MHYQKRTEATELANGSSYSYARWVIFLALSAVVFFPLSHWVATTPTGTSWLLHVQIFYVPAFIVSVAAIPICLVLLCINRNRLESLVNLLLSVLMVFCFVTGISLGMKVRMSQMEAFSDRSRPLIAAIREFETDHGQPPRSLEDLVPKYLPEVPATGMMAYPKYRYLAGQDAQDFYRGNEWVLVVSTSTGFLNFDKMLYFPKQNYPKRGYSGTLELVGDWAYVHE